MLENALWDLVFEALEADEAQQKKAWAWTQLTYEARLEVHTDKSLYYIPAIVFYPKEREAMSPWANRKTNDFLQQVRSKQKSVGVFVPLGEIRKLEAMRDSVATFPWIGATLWKRGPRKEIAWMLGIKNAMVVDKMEQDQTSAGFNIICQEIVEMMPKNLVPPPDWVQF